MKRHETLCAVVLLLAVPGAALAGLYPGALRGSDDGNDRAAAFTAVAANSLTVAKPQMAPIKVPVAPPPVSTQVSGTGMVRTTTGATNAVGGPTRVLPGQIGGASFTPKH